MTGSDGSPEAGPRLLVLVTGLSGAGKSTALAALEDIGFTVVDNLPLAMLDGFVGPGGRGGRKDGPVALGIDVRARDFDTAAMEAAVRRILARSDIEARLIFLDCADDILVQRYSETRRRHPLAPRTAGAGRRAAGTADDRAAAPPGRPGHRHDGRDGPHAAPAGTGPLSGRRATAAFGLCRELRLRPRRAAPCRPGLRRPFPAQSALCRKPAADHGAGSADRRLHCRRSGFPAVFSTG